MVQRTILRSRSIPARADEAKGPGKLLWKEMIGTGRFELPTPRTHCEIVTPHRLHLIHREKFIVFGVWRYRRISNL